MADALIAAIGMSALEIDRTSAVVGFFMVMVVPGVLAGALLGWLAGKSRMRPALRRLAVLAPVAWMIVILLGFGTGLQEFVLVACIPTTVGVLILERGTRSVAPPLVPPAHAQR